jgi:hypothetical protein
VLTWQHTFVDVAVTFSMPRQQKTQQRGVKQNCQHCKSAFSKKKICTGKTKHAWGKGPNLITSLLSLASKHKIILKSKNEKLPANTNLIRSLLSLKETAVKEKSNSINIQPISTAVKIHKLFQLIASTDDEENLILFLQHSKSTNYRIYIIPLSSGFLSYNSTKTNRMTLSV